MDRADTLTLSQTTNFRLFQTETKISKNGRKFFKWVENTMRKGEIARYEQFIARYEQFIARYEQFLLFPVFSKDLYCRHVSTRACLGGG